MITVLNFKQWKEYVTNNTPGDSLVICPECVGFGEVENHCDECDAWTGKPCASCDGDGQLFFSKVQEFKELLFLHFSKEKYIEQLNKDLTDLAAWLGKDRAEFLLEHGLEVTFNKAVNNEQLRLLH